MTRLIAIDWDQGQASLVAAFVRGGHVDVQATLSWTEDETVSVPEMRGLKLRDRLKEAGIAPAPVIACVARNQVVVKEVRFPAVPDTEEPAVVRFQAIKELADNPDDVVIDYVSRSAPGDTEKRAVALAVRKKHLDVHVKICAGAGLKLVALCPRMLGIAACLRKVMGTTVVTPAPTPADAAVCVVLAGEKQAEVAVFKGEQFLLARSLAGGAGLAADVRRNLAVFAGQQPGQPVAAIYVGGKGMGELRERIAELVEMPVHTFDPFAGSEKAVLPGANRGAFAGALGLLHLRAAGDLPINFVSPRQPKPVTDPNYGRLRTAAILVAALVIGLVVLGQVLVASEDGRTQNTRNAIREAQTRRDAALAMGKRLHKLDDWDNPIWTDEIYDLASRADLDEVRLTKIKADPLPRQKNSNFIGQLMIEGEAQGDTASSRRAAYHKLATEFSREGHYNVDNALSKYADPAFTLVVKIVRRAPEDYKDRIEDPTIRKPKARSEKGRMR